MKITCDRERLIEAVGIAARAVSVKTTMPILECLLLKADDNGLRITGNDLEIGVETADVPNVLIEEGGTIALDAKMLGDITRKLPLDGKVMIRTENNGIVVIRCGKAEFKLVGQSGDEFPPLPDVGESLSCRVECSKLKDMIRQTIFAAAVDETKPVMTGELIEIKEGELRIVSTDGFRMAIRKTELPNGEEDVAAAEFSAVLPAKALGELDRLLPKEDGATVDLSIGERHACFTFKNFRLVTRRLFGDFINYERIFATQNTTFAKLNRAALADSIERAQLMSRETRKSPVKLKFEEDRVFITAVTDMGNFLDEIDAQIDGLPIEALYNPRYLLDSLKAIDEEDVTLEFTTPLSPCFIRSETDKMFDYLTLPLRSRS